MPTARTTTVAPGSVTTAGPLGVRGRPGLVEPPVAPLVEPPVAPLWRRRSSPLLDLARHLATTGSLTGQVDTSLPVLARLCDAAVVVFGVAGSRAAGVRC